MKKLSVKDLIEFRRKSDRGKKTFVESIKAKVIEAPTVGGGDYWITSLSAVCNSFKQDSIELVDKKIDELNRKLSDSQHSITKNMYNRNISILERYKKMDSKMLRPNGKLSFLKKSTGDSLLTIKGIQVKSNPSHIYAFGTKTEEKVGAIWFVAKVNGYRIEEVGMFCEMLYRFLVNNYSKEYLVDSKYCIAVDTLSGHRVKYSQIEDGDISPMLNSTLYELSKLL
ncbi:hypothetical protein SAMN05428988_4291 [Chitinophaga sp. YR573]|uniref:hypothetical protein n=1 Tax=Chitinophaga sp. YR573 TaxID=1881040 RepID=UPI0008C63106|nr:hypothetical protein [Chitinophaga sp. YR573]SEW35173.1 hypothetical protein SAMN05428988_4291 [Chitinophaga sp. YR573]